MNLESVKTEIKRMAAKKGWPFETEGQWELARVALKYATSQRHLRDTITEICENFDHCPDSRELRAALKPGSEQPAWDDIKRSCRLSICDGSGWVIVADAAKPCKCRAALRTA